jgi:hypothetical protein
VNQVPYTTSSGVKIGSRFEPKQHAHTTASEDDIQSALLNWAKRSGNDSKFGGDMHPLAEQQRKRAERRERARQVKRARGFMRELGPLLAVIGALALIGLWRSL